MPIPPVARRISCQHSALLGLMEGCSGINAACILTADKYTKLNSFSSYNPSLLIRDAKKQSREAARSEGYENTPEQNPLRLCTYER
jgi:hypothetical protein